MVRWDGQGGCARARRGACGAGRQGYGGGAPWAGLVVGRAEARPTCTAVNCAGLEPAGAQQLQLQASHTLSAGQEPCPPLEQRAPWPSEKSQRLRREGRVG